MQWNKIVKKELLEKIGFEDLYLSFGEGCYSLVLINAKSIATINKCLYNYRVGHSSLSTNFHNIDWYKATAIRALKKAEYVREKKYADQWQDFFYYVYLRYVLILMLVGSFNKNKIIYDRAKSILKKEDLFYSKKYVHYLNSDFSKFKLLVLKYLCMNSYNLTSIIIKAVL